MLTISDLLENEHNHMNQTVSVVILTYNRGEILVGLLRSLQKLSYKNLEIIVIDNNSEDNTELLVKRQFPEILYDKTNENIGIAARNIGISKATGDIVITLDDDIQIDDNFNVARLIEIFTNRASIGAVCFKILDTDSGEISNWCHHYDKRIFSNIEFITDEITEGAVAFRKSVFSDVGYYPTNFFISHEGHDLLCRMLNLSYITIYSPDVCVSHRTHKSGRTNWRRYYYDTRNQILLVIRNYPICYGIKYLLRGLSAMLIYSLRDGYVKYWAKGVIDGFVNIPNALNDRNPMNKKSITLLKMISKNRPSMIYMFRERLFKNGIRL